MIFIPFLPFQLEELTLDRAERIEHQLIAFQRRERFLERLGQVGKVAPVDFVAGQVIEIAQVRLAGSILFSMPSRPAMM